MTAYSMRPPVLTGTLAGSDLADLMTEYQRVMEDLKRLRGERDDLTRSGEQRARAADADALARAMRSGGKDPGDVHMREHRAALADAERRLEGTQRALRLVEQDVRAILDDRAPDYLADASALHAQARARLADAVAAVTEAMQDEQRLRSVLRWLGGANKDAPMLTVPGLVRNVNGDHYTAPHVVAALAVAVESVAADPGDAPS